MPAQFEDSVRRKGAVIRKAFDDCQVTGHEPFIEVLKLPVPGDRHVLATVIRCGAQVILTENLRDFRAETLDEYDIDALTTEDFLVNTALESSRAALTGKLRDASDEAPVLLHPGLADRYQAQVANLTAALQSDTTKAEATSIIRSFLTEIWLIPQDRVLAIELVGALAGPLSLGTPINAESPPRVASSCSTLLVAGGRIDLDRTAVTLQNRSRW